MSEDTAAKVDKKKKFRKRKREETEEDQEEEAELIKQRWEETKILQQIRLRNKGLEVTVEPGSAAKKKDESVQSLGEQFTSQEDIVDKLELKMHEYIEKRLANNKGGLVSSENMKSASIEGARPSKAYTSELEPVYHGKNTDAGLVQEVELPSSYKQQNIEETKRARQKLQETSNNAQGAQEHDVVPRFAKEKTADQLSVKATDDIAFQSFKRKMTNKN